MATEGSQVAAFYDTNPALEHARLVENPIEYAVTWAHVQRVTEQLQKDKTVPLRILDIGGGTGRYAVRLAQLGHKVSLTDISSGELELAKQHASESNVELDLVVTADAREIRNVPELFKPAHYDLILCLGPFYHLLSLDDRLKLLRDCADMVKPQGYIFAAFVTMFAHLRDVARKDPARLAREEEFYDGYFRTGKYTRTFPMHHTHPSEVKELFTKFEEELAVEDLIGCESFLTGRLASELQNMSATELGPWVNIALRFAGDAGVAGAADHILIIARKL